MVLIPIHMYCTYSANTCANCAVHSAPLNKYSVTPHAAFWCALNGRQLLHHCNPYLPLDGGLLHAHVHDELQLSLSRGLPLSIQCSRSVAMPPYSACSYSLDSLLFTMSFARVLPPCFSLLHADDASHHKAVAAGCALQKSRGTKAYSRIVKCQISYLRGNQYTRHLENDVCMNIGYTMQWRYIRECIRPRKPV